MSYSRRQLYAMGEPLGDSTTKVVAGKTRTYGGGGGGGSTNTTATTYTTNIPQYAQPYVTTMLGATQKQLFQGTTDAQGNFNITGFQPYQPYSNNPADYVAGFSPLQKQAQSGVANLQMPGQFQAGSQLTGAAGMGSMGLANQAAQAGQNYYGMATNPYAVGAFMNPYVQQSLQPQLNQIAQQGNIASQQAASGATAAGAFGGTRGALAQNLAQQNALMAQQNAIGQGYNQAYNNAMQNMQFGANLGLQGQQTALSGLGQAGAMGAQLANIGNQQLGAQEGIYNLQSQMGGQEQTQQQNIINQAIQNYATAQQYPMMQLGLMSNMLRGLPMQATTTQSYQATPSALNQGLGAIGSLAGAYKAFGAKGGLPKDFEYNVGGEIEADLNDMDDAHLAQVLKTSPSQQEKEMAAKIMAERQAIEKGLGRASGGVISEMAGGGIVAFAGNTDGSLVTDDSDSDTVSPDALKGIMAIKNPMGDTPLDAMTTYENMQAAASKNIENTSPAMKAYNAAIQAKLDNIEAMKNQAAGQSMMEYFSNLGTQTGPLMYALAKTGKETLPDIFARQKEAENASLGYTKALADVEAARQKQAQEEATGAGKLFETGAGIQGTLMGKLAAAGKQSQPNEFNAAVDALVKAAVAKDPTLANDPNRLAIVKGNIAQHVMESINKTGVAQQGVNVQADVAENARIANEGVFNARVENMVQTALARDKNYTQTSASLADLQDNIARLSSKVAAGTASSAQKTNLNTLQLQADKAQKNLTDIEKRTRDTITQQNPNPYSVRTANPASKSSNKVISFEDMQSSRKQ